MKYYLGIDIGTSGTKTALFDTSLQLVCSHTDEYPLYQPGNGYAEQEPDDWWKATVSGIRAVLQKSGVPARDICGIGLSGQMHGLVMLDQNDNVIRRAIIWCDQRTSKECEQITGIVGQDRLIQITMSPAVTGFTASKIMWVKNHEPNNFLRCRSILLPKDYVRFKLTGTKATDLSDASGMQLLDISKRCWSKEILAQLDIDRDLLPALYESPEICAYLSEEAAKLTGLITGTPVVAGAGDNAAAAIGCGVVKPGKAFATIGTSGVVFAHTQKPIQDSKGRIHTFCSAVPGEWHVMGVTQAAGLSLKWFRDNFCNEEKERAKALGCDTYQLLDSKAAEVPIGSNRLLFLPYLMGERTPHLDPLCRGAFIGLSASHTKYDLLRAVMEGVTFSLKDCLVIFEELGIEVDTMLACGGGGSSPLWRQMLADVLCCSVKAATSSSGGAKGAAILAAVGTGEYSSVDKACDSAVGISRTHEPILANSQQYQKYYALYRGLYPALKTSYEQLFKI